MLKGVKFDGNRIGTSTEALAYSEVPAHLVVIGAGYIGVELGSVLAVGWERKLRFWNISIAFYLAWIAEISRWKQKKLLEKARLGISIEQQSYWGLESKTTNAWSSARGAGTDCLRPSACGSRPSAEHRASRSGKCRKSSCTRRDISQ